jgi:hypothetical protein
MKWWIWKVHWILQDFAQLPRTDILILHGRASKWQSKTVRPCQRIQLQTQAVHNLNQRWKWTRTSWEGKKNDKPFKRTASATENSAAVVDKLGWQDWIYLHCTHTQKTIYKPTNPRPMCAYERGRRSNNWEDEKPRENCGKPKFQFVGMRV